MSEQARLVVYQWQTHWTDAGEHCMPHVNDLQNRIDVALSKAQREALAPLEEAAWNLLGTLRDAELARGSEEIEDARRQVTVMEEWLRKILSDLEDARP